MANKKKKVRRTRAWFVATRGSYLPSNSAGWWSYVPFVAYLIYSFVVGVKYTSSKSIAVLFIVPNWVAAAAVMTYLASKKS